MAVTEIYCPCGQPALRLGVYAEQTIMGETVAKPKLGNSARNRYGQWDLGIVTEAQHEVIHDAAKAGIEAPDFVAHAQRRARRLQPATTE